MTNWQIDKKSTESYTPRLIDTVGELSTTFDFNRHQVYKGCGVEFQNKQYIFGSDKNKRQVLRIDDCGFVKLNELAFDHWAGACGSTDDVIVLCFAEYEGFNGSGGKDYRHCRQASSPTGPWVEMEPTTFDHRYTSIATSPGENREVENNLGYSVKYEYDQCFFEKQLLSDFHENKFHYRNLFPWKSAISNYFFYNIKVQLTSNSPVANKSCQFKIN